MMNNKNNSYLLILQIILLTCLLCVLSGCDSGDKTYSVKGRVELIPLERHGIELPRDFANVTVLAYRAVPIDQEMADLNVSHPNHGVIIDQKIAFDHRLRVPVASTHTTADGQFTLSKLESGKYNLVAYRNDWGLKYLYDVQVNDNVSGLVIGIKPIVDLPAYIDGDYQMEDDTIYRTTGDLTIFPGGNLRAGANNWIAVTPNGVINLYGAITISVDDNLKFMSSDKIFSHSAPSIDKFNQIGIVNISNQILRNIHLKDSVYGIRISNSQNVTLLNSVLNCHFQALVVFASQNINISNCVINGSLDSSLGALYGEFLQNVTIERSVFYNNAIGLTLTGCNPALVKNNYFLNNTLRDVHSGTSSVTTIEYNAFPNSITAITNYAGTIEAYYNDVTAVTGINSYQNAATFTARFNNLKCTEYGIISRGTFGGTGIREMIATNNYWFTTSLPEIQALIFDRNDEDPLNPNYDLLKTVVIYQPFAHNRIPSAGLHN